MDYNSLNNNAFNFALNRLPNTMFRAVAVNLPGINVPAPEASHNQATQYFPGSNTEFETFQMTFIVDENLTNYEELYRWIIQQRFMENYEPRNREESFLVSDSTLITMTNASNPNRVIKFKDMFPISLGAINFDSRDQSLEPALCTADFRYSYFTLEPMKIS